jgi:hypothetical protein
VSDNSLTTSIALKYGLVSKKDEYGCTVYTCSIGSLKCKVRAETQRNS